MSNNNPAPVDHEITAVRFTTAAGTQLEGTAERLTRFEVVFDVFGPLVPLRLSEALEAFTITIQGRTLYEGRATVRNLVPRDVGVTCEVTLDETGWLDVSWQPGTVGEEFSAFMRQAQKSFKVLPEFKLAVADMRMLLQDIRNWCAQLELGIRARPDSSQVETERQLLDEVCPLMLPVLDDAFTRFERAAESVSPERAAAHAVYARRLLHPLLLGVPFMHRTFTKPLGYAGDYEMVNMMLRDSYEGGSVYTKALNTWFVAQAPAEAHRNRIDYLAKRLSEIIAQTTVAGRRARVASLGCGPAHEIQRLMATCDYTGRADFTLIDFNDETLAYAAEQITRVAQRTGQRCGINLMRRSVMQILKEAQRTARKPTESLYDFVYCAGLFDYLPDNIAQRITNVLFEWLAPGGLFVSTNVAPNNPRRHTMSLIMDWHLIYRTADQMNLLTPERKRREDCEIKADPTGVNVFLEARKN